MLSGPVFPFSVKDILQGKEDTDTVGNEGEDQQALLQVMREFND